MHDSRLEENYEELSCPYCDKELTHVSGSTYTCETEGCLGYLSDFVVLK